MPKTKKKVVAPKTSLKSANKSRPGFFTRKNIIIALAIVIVALLLYFFKGLFIAATVNGQPISRLELVRQLEKQDGKTTLESLINKNLILSEMRKKGITVTDEEVNTEVKKIEDALKAQGRTLDDALSQQGISKDDLIDQVKIQKMVEKLFKKESTVTEKDIDKYLEENKETLPEGGDEKSLRETVKEQLRQTKLAQEFQNWLTKLKNSAKINYFVNF